MNKPNIWIEGVEWEKVEPSEVGLETHKIAGWKVTNPALLTFDVWISDLGVYRRVDPVIKFNWQCTHCGYKMVQNLRECPECMNTVYRPIGCQRHTEHAWRGDKYVGRRFPYDRPDDGIWEVCEHKPTPAT